MADLVSGARAKPQNILDIMDTDLDNDQISAAINTAHELIDSQLTNKNIPTGLLTQIEVWLSAHFAAMNDPRVRSENVAGVSSTYEGTSGMGLQGSRYGQQAIALDYTGTLKNLGNLKRATFNVFRRT